jgi:hypothetical protein
MQNIRSGNAGRDRSAGDIMSRFSSFFMAASPASFSRRALSAGANLAKSGNCRRSLTSARGRSDASARRLEQEWRELRRHVTIEEDSEKMFRLTAELNRRCVPAKAADHSGDS